MMMRWTLAAAALAAATALSGAGAMAQSVEAARPSFDCAKARTLVEREICADPVPADLDREMAELYAEVMRSTPTPAAVRRQQQEFLAGRGVGENGEPATSINGDFLVEIYRNRIADLRAELQRVDRADRLDIKPGELSKRCVFVGIENCRVESSGAVAGMRAEHGPPLFYQIQRPKAEDEYGRGVLILRKTDGALRPFLWNYDVDYPEAPRMVETPAGPLLLLPGREAGTSTMNAELILHPLQGGWRDIDIDAWRAAFDKRLPKALMVVKGVLYDWKTLTARTSLWTETDANCCASGGIATVQLAVENDRLVFKDMRIEPSPPRD